MAHVALLFALTMTFEVLFTKCQVIRTDSCTNGYNTENDVLIKLKELQLESSVSKEERNVLRSELIEVKTRLNDMENQHNIATGWYVHTPSTLSAIQQQVGSSYILRF